MQGTFFYSLLLVALFSCSKSSEQENQTAQTQQIPAIGVLSGLSPAGLNPFMIVEKMSTAEVKVLLNDMQQADQQYRDSLNTRPPGREKHYLQKIGEVDQANLKLLDQIVRKFGWPGKTTFGENGAETAWLIIWHQRDKRSILCKYYDLMDAAVQKGEMNANTFKLIGEEVAKLSPDQIEY